MLYQEFHKKRNIVLVAIAIPIASVITLTLSLFFSSTHYIVFPLCIAIYIRLLRPVISRALVQDQRYHPRLQNGAYVRIARYPHDFEAEEIDENNETEFYSDIIGHISEIEGPLIWIENDAGMYGTHINCLELIPDNILPMPTIDDDSFTINQKS